MKWLLLLQLVAASVPAFAGFMELGGSVNYRSSRYDDNNFVESLTYTGSISYYFWETSALEMNYTTGTSKQVSKATGPTEKKFTVEDNIDMTSLDLVLSFADRQAPFRPYVKMGAGYLVKERFRKVDNDPRERISKQSGIVPSGGLGLSVNVTKTFSIKLGLDAWTSPMNEKPVVVDYAGRAGLSWIF